jgi:inosine-uridine nucleoside N-ribohydrolase
VAERLLAAQATGDLHLHDPYAIAGLIAPILFSGVLSTVSVVTQAGPEFRRSCAAPAEMGTVLVMTDVDANRPFDQLIDRIALLP